MLPRRLRLSAVLLAISPLAVLGAGLTLKAARGPAWLAYNSDPEYVYLLNSVLILKRLPPFFVGHPGIPLLMIGAVVTAVVHTVTGQGALEADLIARPEVYISAIHAAALALSALLVLATGVIVARRTSLRDAVVIQSAFWVSAPLVVELSRLRPEMLLVGTTVAFAGAVVLYMESPEGHAPFAVRTGILVGICVALRYTAAPLGIGPLLLLPDWRSRRTFAGTAAAAFLVGIIVSITKIPAMAHWMLALALHAGAYGGGPATVINVGRFLPSLGGLVRGEPLAVTILAAGVVTWFIWRRTVSSSHSPAAYRVLGAMCVVQIAHFLIVAKQPNAHYMVPVIATTGVSVCAMSRFWSNRSPQTFRTIVAMLAAATFVYQVTTQRAEAGNLERLRDQEEALAATTDATARAEQCTTIYRYRASTPAYALQFGNLWSGLAVARALESRYPAVLIDQGNLDVRTFGWTPVDLPALLRDRPCVLMEGTDDTLPVSRADVEVTLVAISGQESLRALRRR